MFISLIIPPSPFLGDQKRNPPLGIMYIAAYLEQNNYSIKLTDLRDLDHDEWLSHIPEGDIYGITATTPEYPYAIEIARQIKKNGVVVVLGGVHASADPLGVDPIFDKVVIGEGEYAIINVINDVKNGVEKRYYTTPLIKDINTLPFPARHLLNYDSFISSKLTVKDQPATAITGSRGCPYNCAFCVSKLMWDRKVRFRTPENIIEEIKTIIDRYGVKHFRFQDDTITASKKWLTSLCEKLKPLGIVWRAATRVDRAQVELLQIMKDAGCYEIDYGIETISDNVLELNNKQITVKQIYQAVENARLAGLETRLFFMIGLPGQDINIADDIINFIEIAKPNAVDVSTFIPFPGSDIYNNPQKYNIKILTKDFTKYVITQGLYGDEAERSFIFEHDILTNEELKSLRKKLLLYIKNYNLILNK